jgi:uncharacterized repeat protein (TIGR01451 family)
MRLSSKSHNLPSFNHSLILKSMLPAKNSHQSVNKRIYIFAVLIFALVCGNFNKTHAAEYLTNNSFELPVAPANGNNFYATIPGWTLVPSPVVSQPANIVVPTAAYANNPSSTPAGGGSQYFDMNSTGGLLQQNITLPKSGKVSISAWFSVRDFTQNLTGMIVQLKNSSGTIVASGTTSFTTADPIGLWKQVIVTGVSVPAGTYDFEIVMDNYNNIDLASLDYIADNPQLSITKSSNKTSPVILGETITYTYVIKNVGNVAMTNIKITDTHNGFGTLPTPSNETITIDTAPLNDSSNTILNDGNWNVLAVGDSIKFTTTYVVNQSDIDFRQ